MASEMMQYKPPFVPMPLIFMVVAALALILILFRTKFGVLLRGIGGNKKLLNNRVTQ